MLAHQPLLLLFAVAAAGWLLGRPSVGGFSLGPAAVLFVGLAVSAAIPGVELPEALPQLGLCLFVYAVGIASGPSFVQALRGRGLQASAVAAGAVIAASAVATGLGAALGLAAPVRVGLFTGAVTNTPALAAAVDVLGGDRTPAVGYSLAYPFGVLVPLLVATWTTRGAAAGVAAPPLVTHTLRVTAPPATAAAWRDRLPGVGFGRVRRADGGLSIVDDATVLSPGDLVTVVGHADEVRAAAAIGPTTDDDLGDDRHALDFRRMFVSRADVTGRPLHALRLPERFGALVTRVRRGDVDLVADRDTRLELGDRVRVLAPRGRMDELGALFGDSYRSLAEIDVWSFALGVALGLALGRVPIPTPVGPLQLGLAGGPLLVGLVLGRIGAVGPLVFSLPYPASLTLRQLGLVVFLAGVGLRSGGGLGAVLRGGHVGPMVVVAAAAAVVSAVPAAWLARRWLALPPWEAVGALAGVQTQPAVLAWADARTPTDEPARGYAQTFAVATITKILVAQALARLA